LTPLPVPAVVLAFADDGTTVPFPSSSSSSSSLAAAEAEAGLFFVVDDEVVVVVFVGLSFLILETVGRR